jgi:outer membrane protein assembly factor BamD
LAACSFLDKQDPTVAMSAEKLYAEAKEALDGGQYDLAIKRYETLEARFPYGRYSQQGQLEVAYAYYKQNEQASAVAAAERFMKLHPNHPNVDYAYYLKGLAYFNEDLGLLGKMSRQDRTERDPKSARESFDAFKDLAQRFPDSKYTPDALARMKYLVNALASHEVHVARYYVKRGAYVAAANRAQYALKNYPEAPAREEALFILIRAYDALGMAELRDDAERILRKNFPDSEHLKNMLSQLGR